MTKFYTGVGSRNTPKSILAVMSNLAKKLANDGWILRSGGAKGADSAFELGAGSKKTVYYAHHVDSLADGQTAMELAGSLHGAWDKCSSYARKLHARNAFQVLGCHLHKPSSFMVCWTPDGAVSHEDRSIKTGGTGTAISIASHFGIKVYNLARPEHLEKIKEFIKE